MSGAPPEQERRRPAVCGRSRAAGRTCTSTGWLLEPLTLLLVYGGERGALGWTRTSTARLLRPVTPSIGLRGRSERRREVCPRLDSNQHCPGFEAGDSAVGLRGHLGVIGGIRTQSWSFTDSRAAVTLRSPCGPPGRSRTSVSRLSAEHSAAEILVEKRGWRPRAVWVVGLAPTISWARATRPCCWTTPMRSRRPDSNRQPRPLQG